MKTLVYCTGYARAPSVWTTRYLHWLRAVTGPDLGADQILIVDDGSDTLPGWPGLRVVSGDDPHDAAHIGCHDGVLLYHFTRRLGRADIYDFPGWHRSFVFGARFAQANGFDRVIHLESDAFLISPRAHAYFRDFTEGWASLWTPRYEFPEIAFQVIAGNGLRTFAAFAQHPYDDMRHKTHETALPFTHIERGFTGERYGEDMDQIPADADYAAQVQALREPAYYWWLHGARPSDAAPLIDWTFGPDGNLQAPLGDGWARPETTHRWMTGLQSVLAFPILPAGDHTLLLTVMPHVHGAILPSQRLMIYLNETKIAEYTLLDAQRIGCVIPGDIPRRDGTDRLRLLHPDASPPSSISPAHTDTRRLAIGLVNLKIIPS